MFKRAGKIKQWLEDRNYEVKYAGFDLYRYTDNFHTGQSYIMDCYQVSNGYKIRVKTEGQARFWLVNKDDNFVGADFSQESFIKQFDKVFPYREKLSDEVTEEIKKLIAKYAEKHPLAKECGGEYIMQDDKAQEDALQLVCDIFDSMADDEE